MASVKSRLVLKMARQSNRIKFTAKVNGMDTPVTKVGDQYYNTADIDPKTGKPNAKANPVTPDAGTTPTNAGDGYVTGNKVATAIQKSGFVVGKQTEKIICCRLQR